MTKPIGPTNIWPRVACMLSILSLGAALAVGLGFPVAGALTGGTLRANFAFALVVMAILLDLAVVSSYGASLRMQQIVRAAWLAIAMICLAFTEYVLSLSYTDAGKAADTLLIIVMFLLTFPAGCIGIALTVLYSSQLLAHRAVNPLDLVLLWSFFFVTGYLQWFKLMPYLVTKLRVVLGNRLHRRRGQA